MSNTNVSLKLNLASRKKGGMAVPAVWRLINYARVHRTQTARRSSQAGRLCSSPKIQKQAAFDISCRKNNTIKRTYGF